MKTTALCIMSVLLLLTVASAVIAPPVLDNTPPASVFESPQTVLEPGTCVAIATCDDGTYTNTVATKIGKQIFQTSNWLVRLFTGDKNLEYIRSGQKDLFLGGPELASQLTTDGTTILCYNDKNKEFWYKQPTYKDGKVTVPGIPLDTMLIELWYPECKSKPQVCTKYNGNIQLLDRTSHEYVFVGTDNSAWFKGAGFYASCGPDPKISTREKVLVAGNSKEALELAVVDLMDKMRQVSTSAYDPKMRYYNNADWATTAVVGITGDMGAQQAIVDSIKAKDKTASKYGDDKTPIWVYVGSDSGKLADIFMNPARQTETFALIDRLNPDTKSTVKVVTSASVAFEALKSGDTNSLAYQLFARLNEANPEKIRVANVYGCKQTPTGAGPGERMYFYFNKSKDFLVNTSEAYGSDYTAGGNYTYVLEKDGKYYVGDKGLVCEFAGDAKGKCKAKVLGTATKASGKKEGGYYCVNSVSGGISGDIVEYGTYWDDYSASAGGVVEFMSGFAPCVTKGIAEKGEEYFTGWFVDDRLELPTCDSIGANTAKGKECPSGYDPGTKVNAFWTTAAKLTLGLAGSTQYCGCVNPVDIDWKIAQGIKSSGGVTPPTPPAPPAATGIVIIITGENANPARVSYNIKSTPTITVTQAKFKVAVTKDGKTLDDKECLIKYTDSSSKEISKVDGSYTTGRGGTLTVTPAATSSDMRITISTGGVAANRPTSPADDAQTGAARQGTAAQSIADSSKPQTTSVTDNGNTLSNTPAEQRTVRTVDGDTITRNPFDTSVTTAEGAKITSGASGFSGELPDGTTFEIKGGEVTTKDKSTGVPFTQDIPDDGIQLYQKDGTTITANEDGSVSVSRTDINGDESSDLTVLSNGGVEATLQDGTYFEDNPHTGVSTLSYTDGSSLDMAKNGAYTYGVTFDLTVTIDKKMLKDGQLPAGSTVGYLYDSADGQLTERTSPITASNLKATFTTGLDFPVGHDNVIIIARVPGYLPAYKPIRISDIRANPQQTISISPTLIT